MAVAFLDRQPLSRKKGHSTIAKAAYNSCSRIAQEDYRKKSGLAYAQLITTDGSEPPDRAVFWQEVEAKEKRGDAQVGYSYTAALPAELSLDQNIDLAAAYAQRIAIRYGFQAVDLAIHYPTKRRKDANEKKENPHLHILTPSRTAAGDKLRLYGDVDDLLTVRQLWQEEVNHALEAAGHDARINVRSVEAQWEDVDNEITILEEKEKELALQLQITKKEMADYEQRTATPSNRDAISPVHGLAGGANQEKPRQHQGDQTRLGGATRGSRSRVQSDPGRPRQSGSAAEQGRITSIGRHPQETGSDRGRPRRPLQYTAQAKRIASRLDALRLQRTAYYITHKVACAASQIAARLEALRYERTAKHYQQQRDNQQARLHNAPY